MLITKEIIRKMFSKNSTQQKHTEHLRPRCLSAQPMAINSFKKKPHENKFLFEVAILQGPGQLLSIKKSLRPRRASGFLSADG